MSFESELHHLKFGMDAGIKKERERILDLILNADLEINSLCPCRRCKELKNLISIIKGEDKNEFQ